jgi:hypothetical protein
MEGEEEEEEEEGEAAAAWAARERHAGVSQACTTDSSEYDRFDIILPGSLAGSSGYRLTIRPQNLGSGRPRFWAPRVGRVLL